MRSIQANNRPSLRNTTNQNVSVVQKIKLQVQIDYSRVRVVFSVVDYLPVPVLPETPFIDRFVKFICPPERRIVPYDFKLVLILAINDLTDEQMDDIEKA